MSESKGIAQTQVTSGSASGGSGSIVIGAPVLIPAGSTLQISNEGLRDWVYLLGGGSGQQLESDAVSWHWKLLDGRMRRSFKIYGPTGTVTISTNNSTLAVTSTHFDDGHVGGTRTLDDLNGVLTYMVMGANNPNPFTGFGWAFQAGALKKLQTLNLYFPSSAGGGVATGQTTISARLSDGSFADQARVLAASIVGIQVYRCSIQFKAGSDGAQLGVAVYTSQYGDSGQVLGFQCATLA